ncbi:putative ebp domain protein [Neofusicoccum parvum UCRNP2]|uniref:Putative ebp domain protein n=1 Tax=Botryosphaeria parva (strain UCR-NP2) TaxID=1287680 RepID=R1ER35_BOTPV|nr:putative ebp domain protein [Neofusicoccum parvum UCRNP2]
MASPTPPAATAPSTLHIDLTTILSLLGTVAVLATAYTLSLRVLPRASTAKARVLFVWHLFDALIHFIFEGSFLWNCFFVHWVAPAAPAPSAPLSPYSIAAAAAANPSASTTTSTAAPAPTSFLILTPPDVFFLQRNDTLFGAAYGSGPFSRLWQEYAKADARWGGADLTVVSLELLTVFVGGPLALWCAEMVRRGEWWVYLFFFNMLWVWFPLWIMYEAYKGITSALSQKEVVNVISYLEKKAD